MKIFSIAIGLLFMASLAACSGSNDNVTRAETAPFEFLPFETDAPTYHSSRSAIDLLSLG